LVPKKKKVSIPKDEGENLSELKNSIANLRKTLASLELQRFESEEQSNFGFNESEFSEDNVTPAQRKPMYEQRPVMPPMMSPYSSSSVFGASPALSFITSPGQESFLMPAHDLYGNRRSFRLDENPLYQRIPNYTHESFYSPQLHPTHPGSFDMSYDQFMMQTQPHANAASAAEPKPMKSRICRHFLRGYCKMGNKCNFTHSLQSSTPSDQIVFLGGLPVGIKKDQLVQELKNNYQVEVTGDVQIIKNYAPRVGFTTKEQAQKLVDLKKIVILNSQVDVRPFKDTNKTPEEEAMVFLGGLPDDVDINDLLKQMSDLGFPVSNRPRLGQGYARNVQLESPEKANDLIRKKVIVLFDQTIDVRPYINIYAEKLLAKPKAQAQYPPTNRTNQIWQSV
jgi:hypothetical protein